MTEKKVEEAVANKREVGPVQAEVDVSALINDPSVAPEPVQVEPDTVIFVAQQDFDGRINQREYHFIKGVPVRMDREQANTWLDAKKGYIK